MTPSRARVRLERLPNMLKAERERRGMTMRQAAAEMNISPSTVTRIEGSGQWPDVAGFLAIVTWLRLPPNWFVDCTRSPMDAYRRGWDDCAQAVRDALAPAGIPAIVHEGTTQEPAGHASA
jgi:transcriptional regulator with XRE-family HTH domain